MADGFGNLESGDVDNFGGVSFLRERVEVGLSVDLIGPSLIPCVNGAGCDSWTDADDAADCSGGCAGCCLGADVSSLGALKFKLKLPNLGVVSPVRTRSLLNLRLLIGPPLKTKPFGDAFSVDGLALSGAAGEAGAGLLPPSVTFLSVSVLRAGFLTSSDSFVDGAAAGTAGEAGAGLLPPSVTLLSVSFLRAGFFTFSDSLVDGVVSG